MSEILLPLPYLTQDGMTALHFAAMNDDLEIARKLVDVDNSLCMKQDNVSTQQQQQQQQ